MQQILAKIQVANKFINEDYDDIYWYNKKVQELCNDVYTTVQIYKNEYKTLVPEVESLFENLMKHQTVIETQEAKHFKVKYELAMSIRSQKLEVLNKLINDKNSDKTKVDKLRDELEANMLNETWFDYTDPATGKMFVGIDKKYSY